MLLNWLRPTFWPWAGLHTQLCATGRRLFQDTSYHELCLRKVKIMLFWLSPLGICFGHVFTVWEAFDIWWLVSFRIWITVDDFEVHLDFKWSHFNGVHRCQFDLVYWSHSGLSLFHIGIWNFLNSRRSLPFFSKSLRLWNLSSIRLDNLRFELIDYIYLIYVYHTWALHQARAEAFDMC